MEFLSKDTIKIDRELSDLDKFTFNFVDILKKYTDYVIVSGYVSILLGRARASEDVDLIVPKMSFEKFKILMDELRKKRFYCLNAEEDDDIFEYLMSKVAVRFAKKKTAIPNIEFKFAKNKFDEIALKNKIVVKIKQEDRKSVV